MRLIVRKDGQADKEFSTGKPTINIGRGLEFIVLASAIIGGTSLTGGSGSIVGAVIGTFLIAVIRNGIVLLEDW